MVRDLQSSSTPFKRDGIPRASVQPPSIPKAAGHPVEIAHHVSAWVVRNAALAAGKRFLHLIAAGSAFVAAISHTMPTLRGREFAQTELDTVHAQIARVRATAVETGNLTLDEGLAELLRGE